MYNRLAEFAEKKCEIHTVLLSIWIPKKSLEITYVNSLNTVNTRHQILFAKLEHFGICGAALQWIKSHFARRIQSSLLPIADLSGWCPSRFHLGPLFFITINKLSS